MMSTNRYLADSEGPHIEACLILEFLIERFNDFLASQDSKVPFFLQALGLVVLGFNEKLLADYKDILSSQDLSPAEMIHRSIEIFEIVLHSESDLNPVQHVREQTHKDDLDEKVLRRIMMNTLREGKIMIQEADYRFLRIFEVLGWMALQCDSEWLAKFEAVRRSFVDDPEGLIEAGRDILWDALYRNTPQDRVHTRYN